MAMEAEAQPFIERLGLTAAKDDFFDTASTPVPFQVYTGSYKETDITVIVNGKDKVHGTGVDNVGTVPAALAAFVIVQQLTSTSQRPALLLNAGTGGGFQRKGAAIGDVYLVTAVANHDRRIPIPGFDAYGAGTLTSSLKVEEAATALGYKTGICTTSNSLDHSSEDDERMLSNDATVKDMEAAAIAWSCQMHNMPFLAVKVVTDIVDGDRPTQEEFMENLSTAAKSLQEALPKVLDYVIEHEL